MSAADDRSATSVALEAADQLGIGMLRIGDGRTIGEANEAAAHLLGIRLSSMIGRTLMETFLDHRVERLIADASRGRAGTIEVVPLGDPRAELQVRAWRGTDGATWVAIQDVSELQRLRRIRAEFIDNLAHELRTPLASIRLLSEGMGLELERADVPTRVRASAAKIDVETARLAQMVTELLDLAEIEQGDAPLRMEEVDVGAVVRVVLDRLGPYAQSQDVRLTALLPSQHDRHTSSVTADPERLGRMLQNLVDNAIKFSPAGAEVIVRMALRDDDLLLEVEDHGPGIPAGDRQRVFERFYKVDRARGGPGGTGLGLSIARHIAERHGGRISIRSEEGAGSVFTVTLPRRVGQAAG